MNFLLPDWFIPAMIVINIALFLLAVFVTVKSTLSGSTKVFLLFLSLIVPLLGSVITVIYVATGKRVTTT